MEKITKEEKRSAIITTAIFLAIFLPLVFYTYTVTYPDPLTIMLEGGGGGGGVTVNFGDSDMGMGANYQSELLDAANKVKAEQAASTPPEELVGSDDENSEAVANTKPVERKDARMQNAKTEPVKQPSKAVNDALSNFTKSNSDDSDGDDNTPGNKGNKNGDKNSKNYYDNDGEGDGKGKGKGDGDGDGEGDGKGDGRGNGVGGGIGGGLAGRKIILNPEPVGCNDTGKVIMNLTVNQAGKVIKVETARGTEASSCLISQSREAAKKVEFESSSSGGNKMGTITYNYNYKTP
jgi:hypothetical protein